MKLIDKIKGFSNSYPEINFDILNSSEITLKASFVVPTYNSDNSLIIVLRSIEEQYLLSSINEVIVINDGSTDSTQTQLNSFIKTSKLNIKVIKNSHRKYSAFCRNEGVKNCTGEVVCFVDSDIIIPKDYLNYHLYAHQMQQRIISLSFRSFIDKDDLTKLKNRFPVVDYRDEFRIKSYYESNKFRKISNDSNKETLPEMCLTCAICYKRQDLLTTQGAPINFVGWGFNDTSMAVKVIALGRFVIPIVEAGVYHINHPPRSSNRKMSEFEINKKKYHKMLSLEIKSTFREYIPELEVVDNLVYDNDHGR